MNLNERGLTDDRLAHSLSMLPLGSIVLLEDIDAAFRKREGAEGSASHLTFSGLLNVLDGAVAGEERLIFMTTNHLEALDPALIRPGRVDVMYHIGPSTCVTCGFAPFASDATTQKTGLLFSLSVCPFVCCSKYQIRELFLKFFPDAGSAAEALARKLVDHNISMAALQVRLTVVPLWFVTIGAPKSSFFILNGCVRATS